MKLLYGIPEGKIQLRRARGSKGIVLIEAYNIDNTFAFSYWSLDNEISTCNAEKVPVDYVFWAKQLVKAAKRSIINIKKYE